MSNLKPTPDVLDQDWKLLSVAIGDLDRNAPEVNEMDLARLRRRVRSSVTAHRRQSRPAWALRTLAITAASVLAAAGLVFITGSGVTTSAPELLYTLVYDLDGTVRIHFQDDGRQHQVTRLVRLQDGEAQNRLESIDGRLFIDSQEQIQPGSVVFYKID